MTYKYAAYYSADSALEWFETFEEAEKWLQDYDDQDGISPESIAGENYIAKITHVSSYRVTDSKADYAEGDWPWDDEYDTVGVIDYKETK